MTIPEFKSGVTTNITTKITKKSISPVIVGNAFTDLADIVANISGGTGSSFYQIIENTDSQLIQREALNFSDQFTVQDNGQNSSTDVYISSIDYSLITNTPTGGTGASYTFGDGLSNDGSGNISLGGNISTNKYINTAGSVFGIRANTSNPSEQPSGFYVTNGSLISALYKSPDQSYEVGVKDVNNDGLSYIGYKKSSFGSQKTTLEIDNTKAVFYDGVNGIGLVYGADYSVTGSTNPRWIPDSAWVLSQLTGGTAYLPLVFTGNESVNLNGFVLGFGTGSSGIAIDDTANSIQIGAGAATYGQFHIDTEQTYMSFNGNTGAQIIQMGESPITVTDTNNNTGFLYAGDYEPNFTARSLATVQYVTGYTQSVVGGFAFNNAPNNGISRWSQGSYFQIGSVTSADTTNLYMQLQNNLLSFTQPSGAHSQMNVNSLQFTSSSGQSGSVQLNAPDLTIQATGKVKIQSAAQIDSLQVYQDIEVLQSAHGLILNAPTGERVQITVSVTSGSPTLVLTIL